MSRPSYRVIEGRKIVRICNDEKFRHWLQVEGKDDDLLLWPELRPRQVLSRQIV